MADKPWFYLNPDRYDDKAALGVSWALSIVTTILLIAAPLRRSWRFVLGALAAMFAQTALLSSQDVPANRKHQNHAAG